MTPEALLIECGCALTTQGWQVPPPFTHATVFLPRDARKSLRYLAGIIRGRIVSATGKEKAELERLLGKVESGNAA